VIRILVVESFMQAHELLMQDPLRPEDRKRTKLPVYDRDKSIPAYLLSADAQSVLRITKAGQVIIPLIERGEHELPDLAMALIEAALVDRMFPALEAKSLADAIIAGAEELKQRDLRLHAILVSTGTEVPAVGEAYTAHHPDVEPDLVICLPEPQYLGFMPTTESSFGMFVHNPKAIVPVRIVG